MAAPPKNSLKYIWKLFLGQETFLYLVLEIPWAILNLGLDLEHFQIQYELGYLKMSLHFSLGEKGNRNIQEYKVDTVFWYTL